MKTKQAVFLSVLTLLASLTASWAFTWHVDAKGVPGAGGTSAADAFPSLQTAIDRAGNGDLILVAEGTYAPISVASSRSLTIRSTDGAENTFLAGGGQTRCATLADEAGEASWSVTLEGFTLTEGVDASDLGGGGVFGGNLVNCILRDNTAVRGGAARGARLENCLLCDNVAALGGGAFDSELVNCTVVGNRADGTGGGVCECNLANCIVQANDSPDGADAVASVAVRSCTTPLLAGDGNSDADACFVDPNSGNWRLSLGSPCLDAGDRGFCTSATDLAGNGRVTGANVDLGAYEGAEERLWKARSALAIAAKTVTIAFDPNGGTCQTKKMTFPIGAKYSGFPHPKRPGHLCTGWYTAAKGGTRINSKTLASTSHKKFYAHWARAVTIAFDPNGGTCQTKKMTFRVGANYSGFPHPKRPGYVCIGWYTAAVGGTRINGKTVASASHKTFYAHWAKAVVVSFDPNGGSCSVQRKKFGLGQTYGSLPTPTRDGYTWTGWYTPEGTLVTATSLVTATRTNLLAHWLKTLTVHPVGDSMTYGVRTRNNPLLNGASASSVAQIHNQGWRGYLNRNLAPWGKAQNRTILFLGTHPQSSYAGNVPHDGYCGENASSYAHNHQSACEVEADVQIIFLGMNDALSISRKDGNFGSYFGYTRDGYDQVLSALHAGSTTPMTILVTEPQVTSLVTEHSRLYDPSAINQVIAWYINPYVRSQAGSKVKILDIESLYSNSSYTDDGFHLSVEGNNVIADRLTEMIEEFRK